MYMTGASLVGLAFGSTDDAASSADSRTVFVEDGIPKNIRESDSVGSLERGTLRSMVKNLCCTRAAGSVATIFISERNSRSPAQAINHILWLALIILASAVFSV